MRSVMNKIQRFEAIFFDMDGTLVDTEPYWLAAETELMERYGYTWTLDDQKNCLGGPLPRVGQYMVERAGRESPEFFVDELIRGVSINFSRGLTFMPGALELLNEIRDHEIALALVSASPRILVDEALRLLGDKYFDLSISSNEVKKSKPDPEPYLSAAAQLGVDIKNCLILEDSRTGIASAQASGAWVLAIPHIVSIEPDSRTIIVESLVDFSLSTVLALFHDRISNEFK